MDFGKELAKAALEIGAITLSPDEPYTWASGYRMPIYNDNRKHLRRFKNRTMITQAFVELVQSHDLEFDAIVGIPTAGLAPAYQLAAALDKPFVFRSEGKVLGILPDAIKEYANHLNEKWDQDLEDPDMYGPYWPNVILSVNPELIPIGVQVANIRKLPFAYMRQKRKEHGLQNKIEGIIKKDENIYIIQPSSSSEPGEIITSLRAEGVGQKAQFCPVDLSGLIQPIDVADQRLLPVEDLVSTGGSTVKEAQAYREYGATVEDCASIFSYDFPEALAKFEEADCNLFRTFGYDLLLGEALEVEKIDQSQHEMLSEWRPDAWNWGTNHGFPRIEK